MSESPSPSLAGSPVGSDTPRSNTLDLTDEAIEAVLGDFRNWLRQLRDEPAQQPREPHAAPIDLHTLLGQFVALRHEVNLQTRAARAQQEQNAETLRQLTAALDALQQEEATEPADETPPGDEALRPLLKTLVDLYDALGLAERECRRVCEVVLPVLEKLTQSESPSVPVSAVSLPFWARWAGLDQRIKTALESRTAKSDSATKAQATQQSVESIRQMLDSLVAGYSMSLQRIDRGIRQHGLEPINALGQPFDPERMEVVEVVTKTDRPSGEVVAEMRRGYLWNGRVFRFAQVSVAKSQESGVRSQESE
jgi:molecular chaperone GrpE